MKKSRMIIIVLICVGLLVGGYAYWMNNNSNTSSENMELTKVQQLITKDLEKNYPKTPREVVKTYSEIISCFYNEEYTEKELEKLVDQTLLLMDEELAANNPKNDYFKAVKEEILEYESAGRTIVSYTLPSSNEVEFRTIDERECASKLLRISYNLFLQIAFGIILSLVHFLRLRVQTEPARESALSAIQSVRVKSQPLWLLKPDIAVLR